MFRHSPQISLAHIVGKLALLILVVALPALSPPLASAAETPKKVLILSGTDPNLPTIIFVNQIIRSTLEKEWPGRVQFYSEALDSHRIPEDKYEQEMVTLLQRKYEGEKFDLIFTLGSAGLKFLLRHKNELFSDTPKVFLHTNEHEADGLDLGQNVTGVHGTIELRAALDLALSLRPGTKRVVVITGNARMDKFWETRARTEFRSLENSVEFTYLTDTTIEDLRKQVASLPKNTIVLFLAFLLDRAGNGFSLQESVSLVAPSSSAPVYVAVESGFVQGVVGGRMISYEAIGKTGAEVGLRVLRGERPQDIPPQAVPSVAIFDWRELRRWGISESSLPPGSIVRFKEPTLWERYKWQFVAIISLCAFEALLIAYLLITRAKRSKAERESERFSRLADSEHKHLEEVVSNIPGVVWESRLDDATSTRRIEFVNDYVEQMLGYTVDECVSTPNFWLTVVHKDDRAATTRDIESVLDGKDEAVSQFRCGTKDGRVLWVEAHIVPIFDESGKTVGLRGVAMDITDRMRAEEALRESENRFQLVSQATKDILYEWSLQTDFVWWNDSAMRSVFGYPLEEMTHDFNWWEERLHPDDKDRINVSVVETLGGLDQMWENEYRFRKMDNSYAYVYHRAFIVRDEGGQPLRVIGSLMDFTERKQSEEKLRSALEEVSNLKNQLEEENIYLQEEIKLAHNFDEIIGNSDAIKYVLYKIEQVANTDTTVLILGETGTGKELVARAIHSESGRKDRPLVKLNCAALSASLIESDLFGHEKGSFTGASARKIGRFELANGATIFLDEIGELPLELQAKLLRVIQEGEFERLGSTKTIKTDVRIIAATNRKLEEEVEKGLFREDLWYRLNVFPITVPPLKQRKEDINLLIEHFVKSFSKKLGKEITSVSPATVKSLINYSWPGNIRELANLLERAVINTNGPILRLTDSLSVTHSEQASISNRTLEEVERDHIGRTLLHTGWRIEGPNGAAKMLGLNPSTLRTRMAKLGIQKPQQSLV